MRGSSWGVFEIREQSPFASGWPGTLTVSKANPAPTAQGAWPLSSAVFCGKAVLPRTTVRRISPGRRQRPPVVGRRVVEFRVTMIPARIAVDAHPPTRPPTRKCLAPPPLMNWSEEIAASISRNRNDGDAAMNSAGSRRHGTRSAPPATANGDGVIFSLRTAHLHQIQTGGFSCAAWLGDILSACVLSSSLRKAPSPLGPLNPRP
jgi:hypothetical protein